MEEAHETETLEPTPTSAVQLEGIPEELVERAGIRKVGAVEAKTLCGLDVNGLWIPYFDRNGEPVMVEDEDGNSKQYGRLRMDRPEPNQKYTQLPGSGVHIYIPPGVKTVDVIVEGEKKALALWGLGIHAVGISGFYGFSKKEEGKRVLLQELADLFILKGGGEVQFLGDTDTCHNSQFADAAVKLLELLPGDCSLTLPRLPIDGQKGVDDCIDAWGQEALARYNDQVGVPRVAVDRDAISGAQGAAELRFMLLRAEREEVLKRVMEANPKIRRKVYRCLAAMVASPSAQETAVSWIQELTGVGKRALAAEMKQAKEELSYGEGGGSMEDVSRLIEEVAGKGYTYGAKYLYPVDDYYQCFNENEIKRHFSVECGLSRKPDKRLPDGATSADIALSKIKRKMSVDYFGPVAGHQIGIHEVMGYQVLSTVGYTLTDGVQGDWSTHREYLERLFGRDEGDPDWEHQFITFMGWLKMFRLQLRDLEANIQGQFVVWIGESGCGKTWWQENVLPKLFTGRYFMQEAENLSSQFNREMGEKEIILFSDATGEEDFRARNAFAGAIRKLVANPGRAVERKQVDRIGLNLRQRIMASANATGISTLPPLKEGVEDKVIYMQVYRVDLWTRIDDPRAKTIPQKLEEELPAFIHAIENFEVPAEYEDQRYGVKPFHHPNIVAMAQTGNPWEIVAELVSRVLRQDSGKYKIEGVSAFELYEMLDESDPAGLFKREVKMESFKYRLRDLHRESQKRDNELLFVMTARRSSKQRMWDFKLKGPKSV